MDVGNDDADLFTMTSKKDRQPVFQFLSEPEGRMKMIQFIQDVVTDFTGFKQAKYVVHMSEI